MATIKKTILKNINPEKLNEELRAAGVNPSRLVWAGFERVDSAIRKPTATSCVIERRQDVTTNGQEVITTAEPGELHFEYTGSINEATLDSVLTSHDSSVKTVEQVRLEKDETEIDQMVALAKDFDAQVTTFADAKVLLKRLTRIVVRLHRGALAELD